MAVKTAQKTAPAAVAVEETGKALSEAQHILATRQAELAAAVSAGAELDRRNAEGDDAVSAEDLMMASKEIQRCTNLLGAANQKLSRAKAAHSAAQAAAFPAVGEVVAAFVPEALRSALPLGLPVRRR